MKKIASVVLSVLAMTFLASCGGDAAASPAGKYALDKAAFEADMKASMPADAPTEGPAAQMMAMFLKGMEGMDGSIELKADNTCSLSMTMMGQEKKADGTWTLDGEKFTMTAPEDGKDVTRSGTFKDGVIVIEEEKGGKKMTMKFQKAAK